MLSRCLCVFVLSSLLACSNGNDNGPEASAGIGGHAGLGGAGMAGTEGIPTCGNGTVEPPEACDDGNRQTGDYCSLDCSRVTGRCGDGIRQSNEACDGFLDLYCNDTCTMSSGHCGDGQVQSPIESCDPGNLDSPGCSSCEIGASSRCVGEPSLCGPSTVDWDKPFNDYSRGDAEAYCTWLAAAQFGSASRVECPGFLVATRLSLSECTNNIERFSDSCIGPLRHILECMRGTDVCDAITAGPTNDRLGACQQAACTRVCEPGLWSCSGNATRRCNQWGNRYEDETDCGAGQCNPALSNAQDSSEVCGLAICEPNTWSCSGNTARLCAADRQSFAQEIGCGSAWCVGGGGEDTPMNMVCDANECLDGTHNCDTNATCANTIGSFVCACNVGYVGNGTSCADIDECATGMNNCSTHATCTNNVGGFTCACDGDYSGDGVTCLRDECALSLDNCGANATCNDTAISYTCTCNVGYTGDGVTCTDLDECTRGTHTCDTMPAACVNNVGSFDCQCPDGYTGDGLGSMGCIDINECTTGDYDCDPNASCVNTVGSYTCMCNSGYGGDAISCTPYATLTSLVPSFGTLVPAFSPQTLSYTLMMPLAIDTLSFTASSLTADTFVIDGQATADSTPSTPAAHPVGISTSTVRIAGPGVLDRTYTVTITRAAYTYLKPSLNTTNAQCFGASVDLSGNTLMVGARCTEATAGGGSGGAVYFFERVVNTWTLRGSFRAATPGVLGNEVAVNGNTAVASHGRDVEVYVRNGNTWSHDATIPIEGPDVDYLTVATAGDMIAVGNPYDRSAASGVGGDPNAGFSTRSGAVWVFAKVAGSWTEQTYIKAAHPDSDDYFGHRIAFSNDTLVVSAPNERSNAVGINGDQTDDSQPYAGAVYVFTQTGSVWSQQAYLKAPTVEFASSFGTALALWNHRLVATQRLDSVTRIHVYERTSGVWSHVDLLPPLSTVNPVNANITLDVWGDRILAGNTSETSASAGLNGSERINNLWINGSGATYLFERGTTGWMRRHYMKASNPGEEDQFGTAVAIDGFIAVGAPYEDSSAFTNGNQADNSANARGAVYIF